VDRAAVAAAAAATATPAWVVAAVAVALLQRLPVAAMPRHRLRRPADLLNRE